MGEIIRKVKGGRFVGWYLRYVDADGRRKQRASKQPSHAEARRMLIEIEARVARGTVGIEERSQASTLTVAELFGRYCAEYASPKIKNLTGYRHRTAVALRRVSRETPQLARMGLVSLTSAHLAKVREALARRYPAGTIRTTFMSISAALSWAVREGLIPKNPAVGVERPPSPAVRLEFFTADEVRRLLDEAERQARTAQGRTAPLWWSRWVALSLAIHTGARKGEVFGLKWSDVDLDAQRLTIARSYGTTTKSGKARHLRLPSALVPLLREWRQRCPSDVLVCPVFGRGHWPMASDKSSFEHGLVDLLRAAGCRVFSRPWHMLRHSFASHFMQSGGSLLALSQILGHTDVKTTMIYAHLSAEFLADQMDRVRF